jgi:hypothetical protein
MKAETLFLLLPKEKYESYYLTTHNYRYRWSDVRQLFLSRALR